MRRRTLSTALVAATLLGLAACSAPASTSSATQPPSTAPTASATTSPQGMPEPTISPRPAADFAGDWVGIATQGTSTHDVSLSLSEADDGAYRGTIRHAELQCSGTLNNGIVSAGVLTIQKHMDVPGNCIVDLAVTLTVVDVQTIRYDTEVSTALLNRP
jgi:hypothetical protein